MADKKTGIRITLEGADEAIGALKEAAAKAQKPRDLYEAVGELLLTSTDRRFELEITPDGSPWPPSIRAMMSSGKTLTDIGTLRGSMVAEASDTGVAVGSNTIYAAIHQLGGTIKSKTSKGLRFRIGGNWITKQSVTIPARPFLGLNDEDATGIEALAANWVGLGAQVDGRVTAGGADAV
jgi:phage virion morphogenesis protein